MIASVSTFSRSIGAARPLCTVNFCIELPNSGTGRGGREGYAKNAKEDIKSKKSGTQAFLAFSTFFGSLSRPSRTFCVLRGRHWHILFLLRRVFDGVSGFLDVLAGASDGVAARQSESERQG